MEDATTLFTYTWGKIITFFFNDTQITTNVTLGYVLLVSALMVLLIRSILTLPIGSFHNEREWTYSRNGETMHGYRRESRGTIRR